MSNGNNDFVWGALILSLMVVLAIIITPIMLVGIPAYIFYRLWKENPKRLERLAREETMVLYNHALAGSANLSDSEVETALATHCRMTPQRRSHSNSRSLGGPCLKPKGYRRKSRRLRRCATP